MKPGERLAEQLQKEGDRLKKLPAYRHLAHEMYRQKSQVLSAQRDLDYSKRERRA